MKFQGHHTNQACYKSDLVSPEYRTHAGDKRVDRKLAESYHVGIVDPSEKDWTDLWGGRLNA